MNSRSNAAFNYEVVEEQKKAKVVKLPGKKARRLAKLKSQRILIAMVFSIFFVCAVGVSGFVMGLVELTEVTDKSCKALRELEQLQSVNTQLSVKLKSASTYNSFKDKEDTPVEIVKIHKGDLAKRS